jgi:Lrp/AsnC family transcriptional regulator for asnA, asnC and gidA
MFEPDELDQKIVCALQQDGRCGNNEIARDLDVSEGTVRNRIRKLSDAGILKIAGMINPDMIPEKQLVFLGVKVAISRDLDKIAGRIKDLNEVKSVSITTGRYDIIIEAWLEVKTGLIKFLSESLASIDGILSTESFLIMKSYDKWISANDS